MDGRQLSSLELETLLAEPVVRHRWPAGLTTDEVLDELHAVGRLHVRVHEGAPDGGGRPTARYTCAVELREGAAGLAVGRGRTLTAAALRCLIDTEVELGEEVRRGLRDIGDMLDTV